MFEAWLLVTCCCCRGHATAPIHHIGRLRKRRALFVLVRGELSSFLNTKLSIGGRCVSQPRSRKSDFCTVGEENLRVSDCYKHGHKKDL